MYHVGVPQHRRRLIAGSPEVVARLLRASPWHRSASDVIPRPRGSHIRNYMRTSNGKPDPTGRSRFIYKWYSDEEACVPVSGPSHCAIAGQLLRWVTPGSGRGLTMFSVAEMAALQCFPPGYKFGLRTMAATRCIGNALPPIVMKQMLR